MWIFTCCERWGRNNQSQSKLDERKWTKLVIWQLNTSRPLQSTDKLWRGASTPHLYRVWVRVRACVHFMVLNIGSWSDSHLASVWITAASPLDVPVELQKQTMQITRWEIYIESVNNKNIISGKTPFTLTEANDWIHFMLWGFVGNVSVSMFIAG